jgi:hypothetical protein
VKKLTIGNAILATESISAIVKIYWNIGTHIRKPAALSLKRMVFEMPEIITYDGLRPGYTQK